MMRYEVQHVNWLKKQKKANKSTWHVMWLDSGICHLIQGWREAKMLWLDFLGVTGSCQKNHPLVNFFMQFMHLSRAKLALILLQQLLEMICKAHLSIRYAGELSCHELHHSFLVSCIESLISSFSSSHILLCYCIWTKLAFGTVTQPHLKFYLPKYTRKMTAGCASNI